VDGLQDWLLSVGMDAADEVLHALVRIGSPSGGDCRSTSDPRRRPPISSPIRIGSISGTQTVFDFCAEQGRLPTSS
jgi:hypothetical protein